MRRLLITADKVQPLQDFTHTHTHTNTHIHTHAGSNTNQLKEANACQRTRNPNIVPVTSAGAKGLKSHQPLRTFLLLLNWPEPLHIKLQKNSSRRGAGGGDGHQPPPSCLLQPTQIWQLLVVY